MIKIKVKGEELVFVDGVIETSTSDSVKKEFLKLSGKKYNTVWGDNSVYSYAFADDIIRAAIAIDKNFKIMESDEETIEELESLRNLIELNSL